MNSPRGLVMVAVLGIAACSSSDATTTESNAIDASEATVDAESLPAGEGEAEVAAPDADEGELVWAACDEQLSPIAEIECATLEVPLDHDDPQGAQIDIAVGRIVTAGSDRIGSLVFNPGGPGGSGLDFLAQAAAIMPLELTDRFDLVSFDPRGVGASSAIDCDVDFDDDVDLLAAGDDAGWQALVDESLASTEDCTADPMDLGAYVGTNNAARDLDLLRDALGDEQLSYVGYSYGTRLGATYAELFPGNVRALVLDGAVKPTTDFAEIGIGQAAGFDRALENFAAACDSDDDCIVTELGATLDVLAQVRDEIAEIGEFPAGDGRVLTPGELDLGVAAALYSKEAWPFLAEALYLAEANQDGSLFQVLTDNYLGREIDGTYSNGQTANGFINCADDVARPDVDTVRAESDAVAAQSQYFGEFLRASTGCLGVDDALDPLVIGPAVGAAPIMVIGSTGDPATPYEWSVELAEVLDSARLYSVEAEGHTAFGSIECVAEPVVEYLVDLELADEGAGCADDADTDFFVPQGESEVQLIVSLFDCLRENGLDIPEIGTAEILADPAGETLGEFLDPSDPAVVEAIGGCTEIILELQGL